MSVQHYGKLNNGKIDADMLTLIKSMGVLFHRIRLILVLTKHNVLYLITYINNYKESMYFNCKSNKSMKNLRSGLE